MTRAPESWDDARELLLPVLRPVTVPAKGDPLRRPVSPFLHELVVVDLPELRLFVEPAHVRRWGVRPDEVFGAAAQNLPPTTGLVQRPDGLWELAAGDGYE